MTRDEIAELFARRGEHWNRQDAAALAADHAERCIVDSPLAGGETTGRDAIQRLYQTYLQAFTDIAFQQESLLIDGNRVALLATITGTDRGGFMGLAPTGRSIAVRAVFFYEIGDDGITREQRIYDFTGLLLQIGAIKAKPA